MLDEWRPLIDNWQEISVALLDRLSGDLMRFPDDEALHRLHAEVRDAIGPATPLVDRARGRVICPRFRVDGRTIRTITVAARFESVADITLDEVRVELIYPEDDVSETFFREITDASPGAT